ncbi:MAG: S41 family peptidase [Alphaproteobacteria bacterium]
MGGTKTIVKFLLGIIFIPNISLSNTVPTNIVKNTNSVEIIPITKADREKYSYNKGEYWLKGTDIVDNFSIQNASEFYTNLLQDIQNNYIYDISYEKLLNYILEGLSGFSGKLEITIANSRVLIHDKDLKLVGNFTTPTEGDAKAWANLIVNIILSLREKNPIVKNAHPEQIFYLTSTYLLKSLDENATYEDYISLQKKQKGYNSHSLGFTYRKIPYGLQVLSIINESPVYFSNIKEGDVITHINATPVSKLKDEEIEATFTNDNSSIIHLNYISYISGKQEEEYLKRNKFTIPSVFVDNSNPKVPVISITNFKEKSSYEVKDAIDNLNKNNINGIVIDVRANNGGDLTEAIETSNLFISGGEILKTKGLGENKNQVYTAKSGDLLNGKPIIVLADNTTKGEAEIFAFILQSNNRAVLVGSPTFGKGTIFETFDLPNKSQIKFTTKQAVSPNDYVLNKVGVIPLVCVSSFTSDSDIDTFIKNVKEDKFKDNRERFISTPTDTDVKRIRNSCKSLYPLKSAQELPIKISTKIIEDTNTYNKLKSMKY